MNKMFGCSGIVEELYNWILSNIQHGAYILELGSGDVSTRYLSEHYGMISIEDSEAFLDKYNARYIHAPLESGWYAVSSLEAALDQLRAENKRYELILIDGPTGSASRGGFLAHAALFDLAVPIVVDDTDREIERRLAEEISRCVARPIQYGDGKHYAII